MKKIVFYFLFSISSFFFYGIKDINTIDEVALIYNQKDLNDENYYKISFYDFNIYEVDNIFESLNVNIISITPEYGEKLEYRSVGRTIEEYKRWLLNKGYEKELTKVELYGFKIDSMTILCVKEELIKLERKVMIK